VQLWYESQLAGTVIGTVLGFLLSVGPKIFERRRTRRCLIRLLRLDVTSIAEHLKALIGEYRDALDSVSKGKGFEFYPSDRRLDEIFLANLGDVSALYTELAAELYRFYNGVARYRALVKALSQTKLKAHDDNADVCGQLRSLIQIIEAATARGDRLVSSLL
jgi:hypothetical protein